ncbi:hypothetical protein N0B44_29335 [Roseibacterium beibuensis]|uniref:hypothetical protein n=1 Tax=[Roseibacterium] beibuensis TaxID=1193142 RepID=UPI00217F090B|nr:hypothetical protein [Roseibacterium beibuensis]MCS6627025.1 hypothetical protein [Roseibacterium beibuensis]
MRIQSLLLGTAALICAAGPAAGQERTITSANDFLELMSNRGTARLGSFTIDRYQASGCSTVVDGHFFDDRGKLTARISLNWAEFTELKYPYIGDERKFQVSGPVRYTYQDGSSSLSPSIEFGYESVSTASRASTAVNFLIESCDRSGGYGF